MWPLGRRRFLSDDTFDVLTEEQFVDATDLQKDRGKGLVMVGVVKGIRVPRRVGSAFLS